MIFPRGEVLHRNLSTAFTDFPALLSTLKTGDFSGIIEIEFPENIGIIFVDSGQIINAEAKIRPDSRRIIGQEAIQTLLNLSKQKDGSINIYRLAPERVAILASHLHNEILFKGLSTDFTQLDRLLLKLKEEKHDGFIEILTKENQAMGVLFLEEGEPAEMFATSESGQSVFGRKSIPTFVENAIKQGAIFNVYRSQGKTSRKVATVPREREGQKELILILQDILSRAEKLVDDLSRQKGTFLKAFKKSLIEKLEEFNFLDPFAGDFDYREGTLRFTGEIGEKDFARGIVECFHTTLSHLEKELPKQKMLSLKLRAEIESTLEQHSEALKRLRVDTVLASFFK
jgi:hypothetical protein